MNKVKTIQEAEKVFDLLGIKEVGKRWQHKKGTWVYELPFKTMYQNGSVEINRFSVYKSGYVRKMVVYGKNNASMSCYQLNKTRKSDEYFKDYKWNEDFTKQTWTGKYRKSNRTERILIDRHDDRVVYLCNYILKNYYRNSKCALVGEYTQERVKVIHGEWWRNQRNEQDLPFTDLVSEDTKHGVSPNHDVQVIINGHRYNLS
jgi:hypothetical protein